MLKKIGRFITDQNQTVYIPRGLMLIDPAERGLRIVSTCAPSNMLDLDPGLSISFINMIACHLPRGPKLRWREDMGGGLPNARGPRAGWSLQPSGLQGMKRLN